MRTEPVDTLERVGFEIVSSTNKRGRFALVTLTHTLERELFLRLRTSAQAAGGWYSRAWKRTPGGFGFPDEVAALRWCADTFHPDGEAAAALILHGGPPERARPLPPTTCPTCKTPGALSLAQARKGYQCDRCADLEEGAW